MFVPPVHMESTSVLGTERPKIRSPGQTSPFLESFSSDGFPTFPLTVLVLELFWLHVKPSTSIPTTMLWLSVIATFIVASSIILCVYVGSHLPAGRPARPGPAFDERSSERSFALDIAHFVAHRPHRAERSDRTLEQTLFRP